MKIVKFPSLKNWRNYSCNFAFVSFFFIIPACTNLLAQDSNKFCLNKQEYHGLTFDSFDSTYEDNCVIHFKIIQTADKIVIRKESGEKITYSKNQIEKDYFIIENENNDSTAKVFYKYHIINNNLLVARAILTFQNERESTILNTLILNENGFFQDKILNECNLFQSFSDGNFAAIIENYNIQDTILFFNNMGKLIKKQGIPSWSNYELSSGDSILKVFSNYGQMYNFDSKGAIHFQYDVKDLISEDLFNFFISPDNMYVYISTFLTKELIKFSIQEGSVVWKIPSERVSKCVFLANHELLAINSFCDIPINNFQDYFKINTVALLSIENGKKLYSYKNCNLICTSYNSIITNERGKYYEYIIK